MEVVLINSNHAAAVALNSYADAISLRAGILGALCADMVLLNLSRQRRGRSGSSGGIQVDCFQTAKGERVAVRSIRPADGNGQIRRLRHVGIYADIVASERVPGHH